MEENQLKLTNKMEGNFKYSVVLFFLSYLLLSCVTKNNTVDDKRIIYQLNPKASDIILKVYNKNYRGKGNCYINLDNFNKLESKTIYLNDCHNCKIEAILKKTNRFLELNNDTYIPVIFNIDTFYEKESKYRLSNAIGGVTIIELDENDNVTSIHTTM